MKVKFCIGVGIIGGLSLVGCMNSIYSSSVSVEKKEGGIESYTIVAQNGKFVENATKQLYENNYEISSLPVYVTSKSSTKKVELGGISGMMWLFSLGIIPGVESGETLGEVSIKTPLGEKTGSYKVEAKGWAGWLPIFLPYPGLAEERVYGTSAKLPNETIETRVREKLVGNLVSQFSKKEFDSYIADMNSPKMKEKRAESARKLERMKQKRAEAKRESVRLAPRTDMYERTYNNDLEKIRECYSEGRPYINPFHNKGEYKGDSDDYNKDWLSKWASPRLNISEDDALAGQALLSEFGTKYLPNAYANYEKKRDALIELQQVFNEEFSQPWAIKATNPKWNSFNKVLEKFAKARTEFFICHDELCYYWLLNKFGCLTDKEFSEIDSRPLAVHLLPENVERAGYVLIGGKMMESKISDFALKYAPESNTIYQKLNRERKELRTLLSEVFKQHKQIDDARYSRVLVAAVSKYNDLRREMNTLSNTLQAWYMNHRVGEMSADDIAKADAEMATRKEPFVDSLPNYIKNHALGPIIPDSELVTIPGKKYKMQRTEVTQLQWKAVMGNKPSYFSSKGPYLPVENVSWEDCQEFIKRASEMDGRQYRLPTRKEWEYACCAGSNTDFGKRANGECGPLEVMGWFEENSDNKTHPVAFKEPNAWGLFDMHGNVRELCQDKDKGDSLSLIDCGGSFQHSARGCSASSSETYYGSYFNLGFRLVLSLE